jgi:glycosyltransferase involved in cell wall biosynthesis
MRPKISILLAARRDSKYLAKFLFGLYAQTGDLSKVEVICMASELDTWNAELFEYFGEKISPPVKFLFENAGLGRSGLAEYLNNAYKQSSGEWIIYFCEDHYINRPNWDIALYQMIAKLELDYRKIHCLIPKWDNAGAMNQILSRGYIEAMGGYLARHGNLDSYINDVNLAVWGDLSMRRAEHASGDRVYRFDDEMFHDFTHDKPNPMDRAANKFPLSTRGQQMPKYKDPRIADWIAEDAEKIKQALERGL